MYRIGLAGFNNSTLVVRYSCLLYITHLAFDLEAKCDKTIKTVLHSSRINSKPNQTLCSRCICMTETVV